MGTLAGVIFGLFAWFIARYVLGGIYTVGPNERAVKTVFGRAERLGENLTVTEHLNDEERERYAYPQVRVISPGGPYFRMPWERVFKVSVATETVSIGFDPEDPSVNQGGQVLEAVTKDQLNTGLTGQIRYTVSEANLYPYLFGVKNPAAHVMGYLHSLLRERIANFSAPHRPHEEGTPLSSSSVSGISINDLRKNLRDINDHMEQESRASAARYGIILNAALITGIDPPPEIDSALAAINTAHNHVSSEISLAQADADQKIVQSKRAVEIETLKAQAEVEPLRSLAERLRELKQNGGLQAYLRNIRLGLFAKARSIILEAGRG